jgi:hypothetical protein
LHYDFIFLILFLDKRRRLDDSNEAITPKFATNVVQNNSSSSSSSSSGNSNAVHAPFDGKEVEEQHRDHDQEIDVLLKRFFLRRSHQRMNIIFKMMFYLIVFWRHMHTVNVKWNLLLVHEVKRLHMNII